MSANRIVYKCAICLDVSEEPRECHGRPMIRCQVGGPGSEDCRPLEGESGELRTRMPRWWIEITRALARSKGGESSGNQYHT